MVYLQEAISKGKVEKILITGFIFSSFMVLGFCKNLVINHCVLISVALTCKVGYRPYHNIIVPSINCLYTSKMSLVVYNDTFDPFFVERFVERYVISERGDTSLNVWLRHFQTC